MMTDHNVDENPRDRVDRRRRGRAEPAAPLVETRGEGSDEVEAARADPTRRDVRHVLAGFFAAGIAIAFLVSKVLNGTWNRLADNLGSRSTRLPQRIAEDDRRPSPRSSARWSARHRRLCLSPAGRPNWTDEVASELAKVSWPSKKEVTNSTMVVILTGTFATIYLALLDRFWGFVTNLVYGS